MKVKVLELDKSRRVAKVQVGEKTMVECRFIFPSNKGAEKDAWVNIVDLHPMLGDGEHKKWLTVSRELSSPVEIETVKKPNLPLYISITNLMHYANPDEYEICRQIFERASKKLEQARKDAGLN